MITEKGIWHPSRITEIYKVILKHILNGENINREMKMGSL